MRFWSAYHRNFLFICSCQCIATLGLMAMVPIMPLYLETIGKGYAPYWASVALAAPAVSGIIFAKRMGAACDRYGYRFMVMITLAVFSVSMCLMALSDSMAGFLVGRLLLGAASLNLTLTAFSVAASLDAQRGRSLGILQSAAAFGSLTGPALGGVMMDFWSLPVLLLATAIFACMATIAAHWLLEEPAKLNLTHDVVTSNQTETIDNARGSHAQKENPAMKYWAISACLSQAAAFALVNVFVLFLDGRVQGLPLATTAGVIHAGAWAATLLFSPWWGRANDRYSPKRNFFLAACGCAISTGSLTLVDSLWLIILLRFLQGACFSALAQTIFYASTQEKSAELSGAAVGLAKQYLLAGQILGPLLVAALIIWVPAVDILYWIAGLFLLSALVVLCINEKRGQNLRDIEEPVLALQEKT